MTSAIPLIDPPLQTMVLADGRQLTWQEFGVPEGRPALYFHGGGSISFEAGIFHREAVERNIRLIATNRPGTWGSSLKPGRPVAAYAGDLRELLDRLGVDRFACFGESNGGMVSLAIAATMADRLVGAVPINPTVNWSDPMARQVTSGAVTMAYRMIRYCPSLVATLGAVAARYAGKPKPVRPEGAPFESADLLGPPPGTEPDIAAIHWRMMAHGNKQSLVPELTWAGSDWGFDPYAIAAPLDFFCGVYDAQGPFALLLTDHNRDARFHHFSYGHHGFSHPDARRRITDTIAGYFER